MKTDKTINEAAKALGRLGGLARKRKLSKARAREIALKAVAARIKKYGQKRKEQGGMK